MRIIILTITLLFLPSIILADSPDNHEIMYSYLAGNYELIGKEIDNNNTYYGKVIIALEGDHLSVTRIIKGTTTKGTGYIEHALGPDEANVLRVRFKENEIQYETTYQWSGDLDNYARISGFIYPKNNKITSAGFETLFIDHRSEKKKK